MGHAATCSIRWPPFYNCVLCNYLRGLCRCNLYRNAYVASAKQIRDSNRRNKMRSILSIVLPVIIAASTSGIFFTAAIS